MLAKESRIPQKYTKVYSKTLNNGPCYTKMLRRYPAALSERRYDVETSLSLKSYLIHHPDETLKAQLNDLVK